MSAPPLKFSILTPSYNQAQYLQKNIDSVIEQKWPHFEHIVVDGASTDHTTQVLKTYPHLKWVSEPDRGQADALNKGLRMASGDIIGWINSDDYYLEGAFRKVALAFADPSVLWVVGDIALFSEPSNRFVRGHSPIITREALFRNPDILRQQGAFFRREFLNEVGGWNANYHMVMDFDLWMRLSKISPPTMLPEELAVFRVQRDQKTGLSNLRRQSRELADVIRREGGGLMDIFRMRGKKEWEWLKVSVRQYLVRTGKLDDRFRLEPLRGWRGRR